MSVQTRLVMIDLILWTSGLSFLINGAILERPWFAVTGVVLCCIFIVAQAFELLWPKADPSPLASAPATPPLIGGVNTLTMVQGTPPWAPPLNQAEYAALLAEDTKARVGHFQRVSAEIMMCKRCLQSPCVQLAITHPIWDGPFDDAGSGHVDKRERWWCVSCDGPIPSDTGRPIRLPYLDNLPIQLLPALYDRPAFHTLPVEVKLFEPPPPAPHVPPGPLVFGSPRIGDQDPVPLSKRRRRAGRPRGQ